MSPEPPSQAQKQKEAEARTAVDPGFVVQSPTCDFYVRGRGLCKLGRSNSSEVGVMRRVKIGRGGMLVARSGPGRAKLDTAVASAGLLAARRGLLDPLWFCRSGGPREPNGYQNSRVHLFDCYKISQIRHPVFWMDPNPVFALVGLRPRIVDFTLYICSLQQSLMLGVIAAWLLKL